MATDERELATMRSIWTGKIPWTEFERLWSAAVNSRAEAAEQRAEDERRLREETVARAHEFISIARNREEEGRKAAEQRVRALLERLQATQVRATDARQDHREAEAKLATAVEALRFYGDRRNYIAGELVIPVGVTQDFDTGAFEADDIKPDEGERARQVLAEIEGEERA